MGSSLLTGFRVTLAGGGALVMAAAATKPADALSNLSGWAKMLGMEDVGAVDMWGLIIGSLMIALAVASWVWRRRDPAPANAPIPVVAAHGHSSPIIQGDGARVHIGDVTNINAPPGRDFTTVQYARMRNQLTSLDRESAWIVSVLSQDDESWKFAGQVIAYLQVIGLPLQQLQPGFVAISGDQVFDLAVRIDARMIIVGRRK